MATVAMTVLNLALWHEAMSLAFISPNHSCVKCEVTRTIARL